MSSKTKQLKEYVMSDVEKHNTEDDAWMVIKGWVLDLTYFFPLHPGGARILIPHLGTDATSVLSDRSIHMHSTAAYRLLKKFRIGYIKGMISQEQIDEAIEETKNPEDYGVDISKGLMYQAASLGDKYHDFIENTYIAPELATLKYFDNPVLEYFSKSPWYTVPCLWIPIVCYVAYRAISSGMSIFLMPFYMVFGALLWMFMEYVFHRFVFHMETSSFFMNCVHFMLHGYHHIAPMDPKRLTFPPVPAVVTGYTGFTVLCLFLPYPVVMAILTGAGIGYICYDCEHYLMHHSDILSGIEYFRSMKRHHLYHHYKNENSNFGISSMLYDTIFQSYDAQYLKGRNRE